LLAHKVLDEAHRSRPKQAVLTKTITCSFVVAVAAADDEEPKQQYLVVARRSLPEAISCWKSQEGETKGKE
jgi:hypothetical protein